MDFIDLFSEQAPLYAFARPSYPTDLIEFIARKSPTLSCAWDCGTGNGQAALALADHFELVLATDPSAAQIDKAFKSPRITYSVQVAEQVDFATASIDALTVAQALHWFNFPRFFAEARRVLKPGGLFCAWCYSRSFVEPVIDQVVKDCILDVIEDQWAPQNAMTWNGYQGLAIPFDPVPAPTCEIRVRWNLWQFLTFIRSWSATRTTIKENGEGVFTTARDHLRELWGSPEFEKDVRMPLSVIAGRA